MTYTEPLILVFVLIALAGLVRRRLALATVGVLGLLLASGPPVDWLWAPPLEARYSSRLLPASPAQAIVVLLSAVRMPRPNRPYPVPDQATFERCGYAAYLYHHWKPLPVLVCGGPARVGRKTDFYRHARDAGARRHTRDNDLDRGALPLDSRERPLWSGSSAQSWD